MDRYVVVLPALVPLAYLLVGLAIYTALIAIGKPPQISGKSSGMFTAFWGRYMAWMLQPLVRWLKSSGLSPDSVTVGSLACSMAAGYAVATGHYAIATWTYVGAGLLDIVDGRLARYTGKQSASGAFLDSVLDRWGEFFMYAGCAWALRGSWFAAAALAALGGSMMVSYTRARAEGLGYKPTGGIMQRPERIIVVSLGCMITAFVDAATAGQYAAHVLASTMAIVGLTSAWTAVGRLISGYRNLQGRELPQGQETVEEPAPAELPLSVVRRTRAHDDDERAAG